MAKESSKWLACRMTGMNKLVVPERVVDVIDDRMVATATGTDSMMVRFVPNDGRLFDSRAECIAWCDEQNKGNPFWTKPT